MLKTFTISQKINIFNAGLAIAQLPIICDKPSEVDWLYADRWVNCLLDLVDEGIVSKQRKRELLEGPINYVFCYSC